MIYVNINTMRRMSKSQKNSLSGPSKIKPSGTKQSRNRSEKLVSSATELFDSIKSKQRTKVTGTKHKRKKETEKLVITAAQLFERITSNTAVLDKILGYLTPSEIKNMSLLSK